MERADGGPAAFRIDVDGAGGADFITGRGGLGVSSLAATTVPLLLMGRSGNDTLVDGLARDVLHGGGDSDAPDNDTLFSVDGVQEQTINGGAGFDTATVDAFDRTVVEQRTNASVGRLRLDPAAVRARAGGVARVGMSWTHPKDWRKLRSLELRVLNGADTVGRVVVKPAADSVRAHGALALGAGSEVGHRGKTVTAKLAVRLPESHAGERLRIDVAAADERGRTQLEPAAGAIEVR